MLRRRATPGGEEAAAPLLGCDAAAGEELEGLRLVLLDAMQIRCAEAFDANSPEHMKLLHNLWTASFPGRPFTLPSEEWKQLGFQGRDPRSDLRGCGVMGLKHLCKTLLSHREAFEEIFEGVHKSPLSEFQLSIASINTTAMLLSHLHLAPKLALSFIQQRTEAPSSTLHGFLSLGFEREGFFARATSYEEHSDLGEEPARVARLEHALGVMHAQLLLALAREWRAMLDSKPETNIMDFPVALRTVHARMCSAMRSLGDGPWQLRLIESALANPDASVAEDGDTPPAWAALNLFLGFVMSLCCAGRTGEAMDDEPPLQQPSPASYSKGDKNG